MKDIEDALQRLEKLTQEALMAAPERVRSVDTKVESVGNKVKGVDEHKTLTTGYSASLTGCYLELCKHAEGDTNAASTRRINMFSDQKHSPTLWASTLVHATLLTLGKDYQLLLSRGVPPPPPSSLVLCIFRLPN